jgi:hypothetical protein
MANSTSTANLVFCQFVFRMCMCVWKIKPKIWILRTSGTGNKQMAFDFCLECCRGHIAQLIERLSVNYTKCQHKSRLHKQSDNESNWHNGWIWNKLISKLWKRARDNHKSFSIIIHYYRQILWAHTKLYLLVAIHLLAGVVFVVVVSCGAQKHPFEFCEIFG